MARACLAYACRLGVHAESGMPIARGVADVEAPYLSFSVTVSKSVIAKSSPYFAVQGIFWIRAS